MRRMKLNPQLDGGKFAYHLKVLKEANLIGLQENGYSLTKNGERLGDFLDNII